MPFAFLPRIDGLMNALERYGAGSIGIVYDVANGHFVAEDFRDALRACRKRLRLVHLSDTGRTHYRHDPVGAGTVPFTALPPLMAEVGYRRSLVLEIISADADRDILASASRLSELGFRVAGR